jgi:hypothetical protein
MFSYAPGWIVEGYTDDDDRWNSGESFVEKKRNGTTQFGLLSASAPAASSSSSSSSSSSTSSPLASSASAFVGPKGSTCPFYPPQRSILAQLGAEDQMYQISHFYRLHYLETGSCSFNLFMNLSILFIRCSFLLVSLSLSTSESSI